MPRPAEPPTTTISVVIPAKDDADLLERCLRALAQQSRRADEIIVVDNDSSDDTADRARRLGATVISEIRPGIPAASAAGYDHAAGDIIARLDADCIPAVDWLRRIETAFSDEPDTVAVTNGARFIDGPRHLRALAATLYLGAYFGTVSAALGHVPLFGSNFAMRRSGWEAVRLEVHRHDAMVHDDMDLSFHLGPERRIRLDRSVRMTMSYRPFTNARAFVLRVRRGFHSVVAHWPQELPWKRWIRRIRSADSGTITP